MHNNNSNVLLQHDDEIDLIELARELWSQRLLVLMTTCLAFAAAVGYAYFTHPLYQAQASILPPNPSDIAGYNVGRSNVGLKPFEVDEVYGYFLRTLNSESLRRGFFTDVYLPALATEQDRPMDALWKDFNQQVTVKSEKQRPEQRLVQVQHQDPRVAADWANIYVLKAAAETERMMARNVAAEIAIQAQDLERQTEALRSTARQRREDRIATLEEALLVAVNVGLENVQGTVWQTVSTGGSTVADGNPFYFRGSKALRAELKVLRSRKSDDPFIPELRSLQERLDFLRSVDLSPDEIAVFTFDSEAQVPEVPIKPRRGLIVVLGLVLGGMLGLFIALVRGALKRAGERSGRIALA